MSPRARPESFKKACTMEEKKYNNKRPKSRAPYRSGENAARPYRGKGEYRGRADDSGRSERDLCRYADEHSNYEESTDSTGVVAGRNAVRELLRSERSIDKLLVKGGSREGSITVLVAEAVKRGIPVIETVQEKLDSLCGGVNHQGVIAMAAEKEYCDVDTILKIAEERGEKPLVVIADCIEDPHNLGALIRCAECAGAHGIIIPKRRSAGLTPTVAKASAGAIEHMAIAKVSNISQTVESLKKKGLWIFASEAGGAAYYDTDFNVPAAIIFGSEGEGIGRAIKEKCDFLVSIPMYGKVNSLNVSTAASVILCHAARMQRTGG